MIPNSDKYIDLLEKLANKAKEYFQLQKEYLTLTFIEKLTLLITALSVGFILLILGMIALFYLSFTLSYLIEPYVGGLWQSYGIITLFILLLMWLVFAMRRILIIGPVTHFLYLLFKDINHKED